MFKKKKRLLRRTLTDSLVSTLEVCKDDWLNKKRVIDASIEPSEEVLYQLRLAEVKYFFLLKEARAQQLFNPRE
ncbi:YaaL family protein [Terrilactibacillus laevilacticus]|uniref:YaaL family protein n=1 Tax=Terrilactibacillus laevilacticus TaxID=1380157 RepID=A0ABW5PP16_9BACI|nr:YaaL family protein [Terrilactibacillus laevilacticus]